MIFFSLKDFREPGSNHLFGNQFQRVGKSEVGDYEQKNHIVSSSMKVNTRLPILCFGFEPILAFETM